MFNKRLGNYINACSNGKLMFIDKKSTSICSLDNYIKGI